MAHRRRSAKQVRQHKFGVGGSAFPQTKNRKQQRRMVKQILKQDVEGAAEEL